MQLGDIGAAEMEALLKQGMTPQQVVYFVKICKQVVDLTNCYAKCVNCLWIFQVFIVICFYCTSFDQVLEHFLKHGKTKEEEEEEVKFQEALAQKRLEQV